MMTYLVYEPYSDDLFIQTDSGVTVYLDALDREWHLLDDSFKFPSLLDQARNAGLKNPLIHPIY